MRTLDEHWQRFGELLAADSPPQTREAIRWAWMHGANAMLSCLVELYATRDLNAQATGAVLMGYADEIRAAIRGTPMGGTRAD